MCCSVLQCVAVCCSVIQRLDTSCTNVPAARNCVDTYQVECSMLQCVAVCCSVFETCQVPHTEEIILHIFGSPNPPDFWVDLLNDGDSI